jgi:SNF2 family DNA or RNA helicase
MQIVDNKQLIIRTRNPHRITDAIPNSKVVNVEEDIHEVAVAWELAEAQMLRRLRIKNVPSPITRDYDWPGVFPPMAHQKTTAEFLTLHSRGFCFNEQGTGKTASAIWASDYLISAGYIKRVLIVCPLSIMQAAWEADLFKFAVHRTVGIAHGNRDKRRAIIAGDYDYVVINYDGVDIVEKEIAGGGFDLIIIDEANSYKSASTKRWKTMRNLVTPKTWLWMMTGTPAAQSPVDAYGLAKLCVPDNVPKFITTFKESVMYQLTRFKWIPKPEAADRVHAALQPAIRFTKKECLDLPSVTYVDREAPLTPQQKKYYEIMKKEFLLQSGDEEITSANAAVNFNQLMQISGGAVYTNDKNVLMFDVSNRLRVVKEVIDEASNKVLVFVPYRHTIQRLEEYLTNEGISLDIISGDVPMSRRGTIIHNFQTATDPRVLIIQPLAAAHGITLTAADTIIWYSPVTSTEIYLQANARIDRNGQTNPMTIVHIHGSQIERRVYAALQGRLLDHTKLIDLYKQEIHSA